MEILLEQVMPEPLQELDTSQSEIWGTKQTFKQGEIVQVQAYSGKGKSTFINIIYGNRKDFTGQVSIDGKDVGSMSQAYKADLRQQKLSIVFQDLRLFPEFSGWDNLQLKLRLTNHYTKEQVEQMASRLGVKGLFSKKAAHMSFGERQRFAIIRSLLQPFDIILLDEPFSHLDEMNTRKAAELITEECEKRGAGALVTCLNQDDFLNYERVVRL